MSLATDMFELVKLNKSKTSAQSKYEGLIENVKEAARNCQTAVTIPLFKKNFFETMASTAKSRGIQLPENYAETQYKDQYDIADLFKADGFKVEIEKTTNLIILGQEDRNDPNKEADMSVSWDFS